ncbi:FAD-dependent 5-carboxymethylaminomethyl-2-thiouridine(34) oxidoreductase MnmC [Shewanella sp. 10N.286.48.B5]|uniref:FAD-dependent 5-carboxymethylaminomethyl-2-thiouridine(34) oxidoreductase MnmC n=1 Tax=Shewanella sp. 10N.286.48.B5 TaxID=1880834 RepID=UPI001F539283|nr:FAD-dependent 5-carboxymethylaminomethyl-2-thiouridine(34) oxidoreductase MnmC [Shewanella sp. 10N.286.48.B5]
MTKLTTDFLFIDRDCATFSAKYPSSYCQNPDYASSIRHYHQTVLSDAAVSNKTLSIAQIGFGIGMELMSLWQLSLTKNQKTLLSIFEPNPINSAELGFLHQHLDKQDPFYELALVLQQACIAKISGCQRLVLAKGLFTVDLYFGSLLENCQGIPNAEKMLISNWHCLPHTITSQYIDQYLSEKLLWQMGRLSEDTANIHYFDSASDNDNATRFKQLNLLASRSGFGVNNIFNQKSECQPDTQKHDSIALQERQALRRSTDSHYAYCLSPCSEHHQSSDDTIAIIGGGIAAAHLALSLIERGQSVTIYCKDNQLADGASGNKQGAIYPLLTPDNNLMSQYFQQAFLFSRRRLQQLTALGHQIDHQFCGVLQTGFDERSDARLNKIMLGQQWPKEIAFSVNAEQANQLARIDINKNGFYYPWAGWICPFEFAQAAIAHATSVAEKNGCKLIIKLNTKINSLERVNSPERVNSLEHDIDLTQDGKVPSQSAYWQLNASHDNEQHDSFRHCKVVIASGAQLTDFKQTKLLQVTGFRGQVSHIPSQGELAQLDTVICAHGYLTPSNNQRHCVGASYVKSPDNVDYSPTEQLENAQKMHQSFPERNWLCDIDVSAASARVGVRMVTRDHCPMMGLAPNVEAIYAQYNQQPLEQHQHSPASRKFWQQHQAPSYDNLFILGGLGSRGLSSGPLAAEALAAMICNHTPPLSYEMLAMLNPNRMWLRKLLKGKALS